jgi:hypothetical protein
MNLLDITIKYFNLIVFVLCVLFGMISFFASWIAWREIQRNRTIVRSVTAAYNIVEDTVEKGRTPLGDFRMDPTLTATVLNNLQEILNAMYGEVTGKPIPPREDRGHGSRRRASRSEGETLDPGLREPAPAMEAEVHGFAIEEPKRGRRRSGQAEQSCSAPPSAG